MTWDADDWELLVIALCIAAVICVWTHVFPKEKNPHE